MEFRGDRHCLPGKIQRRRNRTNFGKEDGVKMAPVAESIESIVSDSQLKGVQALVLFSSS